MSFGKKLKMLRVINKLNQTEMMQRLTVSQPVYSRYENDEKEVSENDGFVIRVSLEFKVTLEWLFDENDSSIFITQKTAQPEVVNGNEKPESIYTIFKDYIEACFKQQQQMLEMIMNKLGG